MGEPQTTFLGYVRENGEVGVRDYRLALPSVVCATRAAARAVEGLVDGVTVEHPVGCAQIGADREQTFRVLVGIGAHPNVRQTAVVGLGCEGVPAEEVGQTIRDRRRQAAVTTIQASGGTREAAQAARARLEEEMDPAPARQPVGLDRLIVGVGPIEQLGDGGRALVQALLDRGGRVIQVAGTGDPIPYATPALATVRQGLMQGAQGASEAITGLVASGAQIIVAQCDADNIGGHPVAPVIRLGYDAGLQAALVDDMDGMVGDKSPEAWVDWIVAVASGASTAAEESGASTFAIQRIGPTL